MYYYVILTALLFIVVLQYVIIHRVEQIWSAKTRLYANLM